MSQNPRNKVYTKKQRKASRARSASASNMGRKMQVRARVQARQIRRSGGRGE